MKIATIYFKEIEDRFLVPFYLELKRIKSIKGEVLGKFVDLFTGKRVPQFSFVNQNYHNAIKYFNVQDIKTPFLNNIGISWINPKVVKITPLKTGDLIVSRVGTAGKVSIVTPLENNGAFTDNAIIIRIKDNSVINPFLCVLFLNSRLGYRQIRSRKKGTLQEVINYNAIKNVRIPEIGEGKKDHLNKMVKLAIDYHIRAINNITRAKQIFEEEININYKNIKEEKTYLVNSKDLSDILLPKFYYPKYLTTLKLLKKKFKTVKIGDIADIKRGDEVGSENYKKYIEKSDSDVPFIRTSDLVNYEVDNYPDYYIDEDIYKELNQDLKEGDILYTKDGKIGLTAMVTQEDKYILASGIARIRIKKDLDPYYVFLVLSTEIGLYQALQRVVTAATIPHLQSERLAELEIPLINPQKQKEISNLIKEAFELKSKKKKLIKEAINQVENLLKI